MATIKKNIWILFYIIIFIGFTTLLSIIYSVNSQTISHYKTEQENITKMTANSFNSVFVQYEMVLNIIGSQILKDDKYNSPKEVKELFDDLIKLNPSIKAFALSNTNGDIYISSSNLDNYKQNLLQSSLTKDTFKEALKTNKLVIGRTYYHEKIKKLIVPIRRAIINEEGRVLSVISAGIDLKEGFNFFINNSKINSKYETFLFRDFDNYFQIAQKKYLDDKDIYKYKIPQNLIDYGIALTEKKYNIAIENIKEKELIVTIRSEDKRDVYHSSIFLNKYQIWVTTQIPYSIIKSDIINKSALVTIIFVLVSIILFYLFKYIYNADKKKEKALFHQANHDYLTNLNNRQFLSNEFEKKQKNKEFSLLFIDIDNFKNVNDNYGHFYGDLVLKEISSRLQKLKKKNDYLIRYSGDEFILISNQTKKEKLNTFAKELLAILSAPYFIHQYKFNLSASLGISRFPKDGENLDEIKRCADMAMYKAKKNKNTFYFFTKDLKDSFQENSILEEELKNSLNNKEIFMMYQPQIDNEGKIYGIEALVRWDNKKLGFIAPDRFIKIAEDIGFINKLGEFIINTSLKEINEVKKITNKNLQLSINISLKQFLEKRFYETLLEQIEKNKFDKSRLTLELTENIFINDIDFILNLLEKLRVNKITISLDDFGTGYSSLSLLKKLPINELKIDKSFVDDILENKSTENMVKSIISIAKEFDMHILSEGIEEEKQKKKLDKLGCDLYQGYLYSKPLKKEDLINFLNSN